MAKSLVIVESPAKARTLARFLGPRYQIKASLGHIRDLPRSKLGVDVKNDFLPTYEIIAGKKAVVAELKKEARGAPEVYLATDPDREGEAISWHLLQALGWDDRPQHRVEFHELTPQAVAAAFRHPRSLNLKLVEAQQARRILDRLVGYKLSPLLNKKVQRGLSAGRVQSVALRLIVDRERQVEAFTPQEYWAIQAELAKDGEAFRATLIGAVGAKEKLSIPDEGAAHKLVAELEAARYRVEAVQVKEAPRHPAAPFTTSTLQQEAWRKLRFTARRTMALAQQLYEGLPLGEEGNLGLITYMRTDSTRVAAPALREARTYIKERFGPDYLPPSPRLYTKKAKGAQEAHEAIRPTSIQRQPQDVKPSLTRDQLQLYELIWKRMAASQMASALMRNTSVEVIAQGQERGLLLRASASVVKFPGFLVLYTEGQDEAEEATERPLPSLKAGDALSLLGLYPDQRFTQPPPRYTEASLIKAMEENGIGRPSTYAPTIAILDQRRYIARQGGRIQPTELGMVVSGLLLRHFPEVVDISFTARMEEGLDEIARGEHEWVALLKGFYAPFDEAVQRAAQEMESLKAPDEPTEVACDKCGQPMVIKEGRYGRFLSCSGFPRCKNARPLSSEGQDEPSGKVCQKCGQPMVIKVGRYGKFLACSGYPQCRNTQPLPTGAHCPQCQGELVQRRGRGGSFYGCSNYPQCRFTARELPQADKTLQAVEA